MSLYLTTPIYYVNAEPHLGHAYSTIVADVVCRFKRMRGEEARFQTGTDEHGDKVVQAAARAGASPREYVDRISRLFREAWPVLGIFPDNFIRTTDQVHVDAVQAILQRVYDQGDIYFSEYSGLYCEGCERFLTEKELVDKKCPDHLTEPAPIAEKNYFFRMSKYQDWLVGYIQANPDFITPERYRNEVLSFLREPLSDLCISRPTSRLTWGIPLPFDAGFVTYVWFDALINYITGIGFPHHPDFARHWAAAEHIIAKDILKPHAIYWPTMLKAMGLTPFRRLHVHGYWNVDDTKMSKSLGNVVRPGQLVEDFGVDVVRYFIMREMSFGLDASFSTDALLARQNSDLANDLGNLFSRSLTMVLKYCGGRIPEPGSPSPADQELKDAVLAMLDQYVGHMEAFAFNRALAAVWEVISLANKYIVVHAPWEMAKDPAKAPQLATVLYSLLETLRLVALVLQPIMPATAARMNQALAIEGQPDMNTQGQWGLLPAGKAVAPPEALFPRMERKKGPAIKQTQPGEKPTQMAETVAADLISFDDFKRIDLRVAEIVSAERVPRSDRLLKLLVRAPEERTIVAGIAEYYAPEDLVGKQVIIVANLKPAKLMGIASQGMVLAAREGQTLLLSAISGKVSPGVKLS